MEMSQKGKCKQKQTLPQGKWLEKIFQANGSKMQTGVAILIYNKLDFKSKFVKRDGEGIYILKTENKQTNKQNCMRILSIYAPIARVHKSVNKSVLQYVPYIDPHTFIVGDFSTPISP